MSWIDKLDPVSQILPIKLPFRIVADGVTISFICLQENEAWHLVFCLPADNPLKILKHLLRKIKKRLDNSYELSAWTFNFFPMKKRSLAAVVSRL